MRHVLVLLLGFTTPALAATTVEALLSDAARLGSTRATGWTDTALTKHLQELSTKAGVTLPIDPSLSRAGAPQPGHARWKDASFSDQGPRRPHVIDATLAAPGPQALASVGGSLLVVKGSAQLGYVVDSVVIVTGDATIAFLTNSVVVSGGRVSVSHLDGSTLLADRLDLTNVQQRRQGQPCVLGAVTGLMQREGAALGCRLFSAPARHLADPKLVSEEKSDPTLISPRPLTASKVGLVTAPSCGAALARGSKAGMGSVGVATVPWRPGKGGVPAEFAGTVVLETYDDAVALERGGEVVLVKAERAKGDEVELRAPELLELGGDFELHGIGFNQPGQLEPTKVRVTGGSPVVLVLAASLRTRWDVEVDDGTSLLGVVLLGAGGHRVTFTRGRAPVVFDADRWPCSRQWGLRWDPSEGAAENGKVLERLKTLLGRPRPLTFTSTQGGGKESTGSTGNASYVVGAARNRAETSRPGGE